MGTLTTEKVVRIWGRNRVPPAQQKSWLRLCPNSIAKALESPKLSWWWWWWWWWWCAM